MGKEDIKPVTWKAEVRTISKGNEIEFTLQGTYDLRDPEGKKLFISKVIELSYTFPLQEIWVKYTITDEQGKEEIIDLKESAVIEIIRCRNCIY